MSPPTPTNAKDDPEDVLAAARRLAEEGKFEQALEKHAWFHNHVLDVDQSYRGVRLSFALSDWVKLGKKYPKALVTLRGIRDEKPARLLAGISDSGLFHDVQSINDYLKKSQATVDLFKKLEETQPEFAASLFRWAEKALIAAGEFRLAKKYLGDPMARLADAKHLFDDGVQYANAKSSPSGDAFRKAYESIFSDEVVRIITVLDKTGHSEMARKVQSQALIALDSPIIRSAISK